MKCDYFKNCRVTQNDLNSHCKLSQCSKISSYRQSAAISAIVTRRHNGNISQNYLLLHKYLSENKLVVVKVFKIIAIASSQNANK